MTTETGAYGFKVLNHISLGSRSVMVISLSSPLEPARLFMVHVLSATDEALDIGALDIGALDIGALDIGALDIGALELLSILV
jgi:hypothetical protein